MRYNKRIETEKFTISPSSMSEIEMFLNIHLGESLINIISIMDYICECKVKTSQGEKVVLISIPAKIVHHKLHKK